MKSSGKTSGALKPGEVANSELVAELINIIRLRFIG